MTINLPQAGIGQYYRKRGDVRPYIYIYIYCTHVHMKKALLLIGELLKGAVCSLRLKFDPQLENFDLPSIGDTIEW